VTATPTTALSRFDVDCSPPLMEKPAAATGVFVRTPLRCSDAVGLAVDVPDGDALIDVDGDSEMDGLRDGVGDGVSDSVTDDVADGDSELDADGG
jgi:hypothetical protein